MKRLAGFLVLAAPVFAAPVTFTKDVAPILQKNCQACHRPGEIAPMSFLTYKEVRPWAKSIREATARRQMPPWFADPKHGDFSNNASLAQKDIDTLAAWAQAGAPEGDPKDLPPNPKFVDGWNIGQPDAVVTMAEEFKVPSEGVIPYKYFSVETNFPEDRYVQFAEIRPGDRKHVHHVIIGVRFPGQPARGEGQPAPAEDSDGRLVGWAPGEAPLMLRAGQAKLLKKGAILSFQVHYTTNGEPGKDKTSVGLIFAKTPVEKRVITAGAFARNLVIPAGEPNYESNAVFTFKEDSHIDSLHPHMHFRGKDFQYKLVYPDGTSKILLEVPHYNFAWQLTYFLREPIAAPKGSRLEALAHHDNSVNNKFNPDPAKEVHWGEQTWDEMMIGYLDYTIDNQNLTKPAPQTSAAVVQ